MFTTLFNCYNLPAASWLACAWRLFTNYLHAVIIGSKLFVTIWHEIGSHFNISQFQLAPEMYIGCPAAAGAGAAPVGDGADAGPAS